MFDQIQEGILAAAEDDDTSEERYVPSIIVYHVMEHSTDFNCGEPLSRLAVAALTSIEDWTTAARAHMPSIILCLT
jgi:hypothetical protein